ncbi:MAG TPA: hypothetical protein IAA98_05840 [Candidatus Avipropionibacterium avicola]|uniref:Uncharacterized protein n=1 Tax=Candidatus Avipropionibacterium avicola TaxID=2840701 RepID=A0A9D1GYZ9_9ACTN|nr:hypothetical protein [Candidatus Avipropionibacterium avicola]
MTHGPQDPPATEFPQYQPGASYQGEPRADGRYAVLIINERAGQQNIAHPNQVTDVLPEDAALAFIASVARREQQAWVEITDKDLVLQISPRELMIYRPSSWAGDRVTRVVIGQVR